MKWWPYYSGHYLLNKGTDLKQLFNEYDSDRVMDMIDTLIIEDSIYDEDHEGRVVKKRTSLNKDYRRYDKIDRTPDDPNEIDPSLAFDDGPPEYLELGEDGMAPGLDPRIPMFG